MLLLGFWTVLWENPFYYFTSVLLILGPRLTASGIGAWWLQLLGFRLTGFAVVLLVVIGRVL